MSGPSGFPLAGIRIAQAVPVQFATLCQSDFEEQNRHLR
jgi:hypothetical protein